MRSLTGLFVALFFIIVLIAGSLFGEADLYEEPSLPVRPAAYGPVLTPVPPAQALSASEHFAANLSSPLRPLPESPAEPERGFSHRTLSAAARPDPAAEPRAAFSLKVNDIVSPYRVQGLFVMPGETVSIEPVLDRPGTVYDVRAATGEATRTTDGWQWTAPRTPGARTLFVEGASESVQLNVFVKTPFDNSAVLNGYQIGGYETKPLRGDPAFAPPEGLIEVNDANADLRVSPHFTLGMFTCHQPGDPKFVMLDERLLLKLEMLLEEVNRRGISARTFHVMSAYRTPWYNASIGNTTKYSLHLFGRAADIFIDEDGDGRMDDLNNDGTVSEADARLLYDLVDSLKEETWYHPFIGGLGLYGPRPHRGPFIHVDVRGQATRW